MPSYLTQWDKISDMEFAILPIGSTEQHGHHLPLFTDSIIAMKLAEGLAAKFSKSYLLPIIPFSSSFEHSGFPGSVSLKVRTITYVIEDILESLAASGIQKCVIVNGHQGNFFLSNLVQELNRSGPRVLLAPSRSQWERAYSDAGISTTLSADMHAGEAETSLLMHLAPETINHDGIKDVDCTYRPLLTVHGMSKYSVTGAIGYPSRASVEKGVALFVSLLGSAEIIINAFMSD